MTYYHGTDRYFKRFDIGASRSYMDFGAGIYLTEKLSHAQKVAFWKRGAKAYVYTYRVNMNQVRTIMKVREFSGVSTEWVKFIIDNRTGYSKCDYDIVIGPTADSSAQKIITNFSTCYKNPTSTDFKRLKEALNTHVYPIQTCLKSIVAVEYFNDRRIEEDILK